MKNIYTTPSTLILALTATLAGGCAPESAPDATPAQGVVVEEPSTSTPATSFAWAERPSLGADDAPVTIVEYTDYQCPFCARYHNEVYPEVLTEHGSQIRYQVRHFPLKNLHPNAENAARAAVCAHWQGRFWEYQDLLFGDRASGLERPALEARAAELGLDQQAFVACLDAEASRDVVSGDFLTGIANNVRSTPSFLVNGRLIGGAQTFEQMEAAIEAALAGDAASP
jgi:protein-disulfide isomerase